MDLLFLLKNFVTLVVPFLLVALAYKLLTERRASPQRNEEEEDVNPRRKEEDVNPRRKEEDVNPQRKEEEEDVNPLRKEEDLNPQRKEEEEDVNPSWCVPFLLGALAYKLLSERRASPQRNEEEEDVNPRRKEEDLNPQRKEEEEEEDVNPLRKEEDLNVQRNGEDEDVNPQRNEEEEDVNPQRGGEEEDVNPQRNEEEDVNPQRNEEDVNEEEEDVNRQRNEGDLNPGTPSPPTRSSDPDREVVLNFSGGDTPEGFAGDLYRNLINAGIRVFPAGERLGEGTMKAIRSSKILIPVISANYASSTWSLNKLAQMMECKKESGHIVLPIFYKVNPTDVRDQTGSFGEAFRYHSESFDGGVVDGWEEALREVGSIRRWEVAESEGDEGQWVELVVRKVLIELKKALEPVIIENSVGIEGPVRKIMDFVDSRGSTLYVGIYGEGGVGKTTLAKVIYNKLFERFDHCSFIPSVTESYECNRIEYLRKQLIWDLGKIKVSEGQLTATLSSSFKSDKVLILLDDVNTNDQLKALVGERNWFAPGSRIIITTREKSILDCVDYPHEHKAMEEHEAKILFARHAFRRDSPPCEYSDLSDEVVSAVHGFPLTLEIIGSYLCGKDQASWERTKRTLQLWQQLQNSQERLEKILEIVYYALKDEQRKIFLDIACFLVGSDARIASYMWDTSDFNPVLGIEELISLSLIKIGDNHELIMHDEVRDFGRSIVRRGRSNEPDNGNSSWVLEEAFTMLGREEGTANTRRLSLDKGSREITKYTDAQFKKLVNLRFVRVSDADFVGDFDEIFSKLRWLQWERCPDNLEAKNFAVGELAVLDLSRSMISDNWSGWKPITSSAKKLKVLNLTGCDSLEDAFFLSHFEHLEILILRNCKKLRNRKTLKNISSIGQLRTLVSLDLRGCRGLEDLPEGVGNLGGLKELFLDETLIEEIGDIMSLVNLQRLSLQGCPRVTLCWDLFLKLESLTELVLTNAQITKLPVSIVHLQSLGVLKIGGTGIEELEDYIGELRKLRVLDAQGCTKLNKVTPRICNLSSLQSLDLRNCLELSCLPELPSSLTVVTVTCTSVTLPSFSHLIHLKQLRLLSCTSLTHIPELPPTTLELEISGCKSLKSLTPPVEVQDFKVSLKRLDIIRCESLGKMDLSKLSLLRVLRALDCRKIQEIEGLERLGQLESLTILEDASIELDKPFSRCSGNGHITEHIAGPFRFGRSS